MLGKYPEHHKQQAALIHHPFFIYYNIEKKMREINTFILNIFFKYTLIIPFI